MGKIRERVAPAAIIALAVLWFLHRAMRTGLPAVDFAPIWLAGKLWNAGLDPYGPDFTAYATRFFSVVAGRPVWWLYPAQWMPVARLFGLLTYAQARIAWLSLSAIFLAGALAMFWIAAARLPKPPSLWLKSLVLAFLLTMEATVGNMYLGQTGPLMLLGFAALVYGLATRRPLIMLVAQCVLMLKPPFGMAFVAAAIAIPVMRLPTLVAVVVTAVAWFAGHAAAGPPLPNIAEWLAGLSIYNLNPFNVPLVLTGVIQLTERLSFVHIPVMAFTLIGSIAAFLLVLTLRRGSHAAPGADLSAFWFGSTVALFTIVPLHNYDLSIIATLLFFLPVLSIRGRIVLVVVAVILHQVRGLAGMIVPESDFLHAQALVSTFALLVLAGLTVSLLVQPRRIAR